jgi:hypothetical protein
MGRNDAPASATRGIDRRAVTRRQPQFLADPGFRTASLSHIK